MAYTPGGKGFNSKFRISLVGDGEVLASLARLGKVGAAAAKQVLLEKTKVMAERAKPLTPDDPETPGLLRDTVRAIRPSASRTGKVTGGIQAGGAALEARMGKRGYAAWALVQHEDLTLKHTSGGPKYLERAVVPMLGETLEAVEDAVDKLANQYEGALPE